MELRAYWTVILRRWWIVAGTLALALAASLAGLALVPQAISYQATVRLSVVPVPEPRTGNYYTYDEYYAYLSSEYLNDDVIELVQGGEFLRDLQTRLQGQFPAPPSGTIRAKKAHRVLAITVTSSTGEGALALARAARDALTESDQASRQRYYGQLTAKEQVVSVVDPPAISAGPGTRAQLDIALRGAVGLLAGLALAFLVDYLDDTLRDSAEVERALGVPVLGEIPTSRRGMRAPSARPESRSGRQAGATGAR